MLYQCEWSLLVLPWLPGCWSGFSIIAFLFPSSIQRSVGGHCAQPTLQALGVRLPLLRAEYHIFTWNYSIWMVCLFSVDLFFSHLYVSEWTYGYLFCTLYYNTIFLGLFFCSHSNFGHWELFQLTLVSFDMLPLLWVLGFFLFCVLSIFFFSGAIRCSRFILYIFPFPFLESRISPRNPSFHLLENNTRNQALGIRCTCYY